MSLKAHTNGNSFFLVSFYLLYKSDVFDDEFGWKQVFKHP